MSYSNELIYREIILDHVKNPRNFRKQHDNYLEKTLKNPSCGDIVTVYVSLEKNIIKDITYNVEGCSICSSSVSMMSELLIGKTISDAEEIIKNFNNMIIGASYDDKILGDAISLKGIINVPTRIKCATLGYKALMEAIGIKEGEESYG